MRKRRHHAAHHHASTQAFWTTQLLSLPLDSHTLLACPSLSLSLDTHTQSAVRGAGEGREARVRRADGQVEGGAPRV